ncbi:MAG: glycosyltransferase [Oscillospiraceae bacterium]|jgi:glycosyltransferase involved in cell wall biosynthesis|nr:glycosyltransferase [Oscillospiraceae bacterium]
MKILLVIDQYFSANNGMTISARRFVGILREHGNEVRIVSTGKEGDTQYLMDRVRVPIFDKVIQEQGMQFAKTDIPLLKEAIKWADIVHFQAPFMISHNGIMLCKDFNVPYTAAFHVQPENVTSTLHLSKIQPINAILYWAAKRYVFRYCSHIHCPSNFIAKELRRHNYKGKIHVISNGIDPDFKYRKIEKSEQFKDKFIILTIGRLSIEKRQDLLMHAVEKSKYKDQIQVIIAGQGPLKKKLEKLASKMDFPVLIKFFSKEDLLDIIAMSDLYAHPAEVEIEAMSCMEAFASGLVPIICDSKKSATPQFALDKDSLFEKGNADDLAQKIDYWIENTKRRKNSELEYSQAAKKYDLDNCVRQIEDMFKEALREHSREYTDN